MDALDFSVSLAGWLGVLASWGRWWLLRPGGHRRAASPLDRVVGLIEGGRKGWRSDTSRWVLDRDEAGWEAPVGPTLATPEGGYRLVPSACRSPWPLTTRTGSFPRACVGLWPLLVPN